MKSIEAVLLCGLWLPILGCGAKPQDSRTTNVPTPSEAVPDVAVPERVAALVRPLLDLNQKSTEQCGAPGTPSRCMNGDAYVQEQQRRMEFGKGLDDLMQRGDPAGDEALVVLMCFYVGESQEETDAVIGRGHRMLIYLDKYQHARPLIPERNYPASMSNDPSVKGDNFEGARRAIEKGWHSTSDNPEG